MTSFISNTLSVCESRYLYMLEGWTSQFLYIQPPKVHRGCRVCDSRIWLFPHIHTLATQQMTESHSLSAWAQDMLPLHKRKKITVVVSQWLKVIGVWWNMNWNLIFPFHFQMSLISQEMFGVWRNYMKIWATASDTVRAAVRAAILENLHNQQGSGIMSKKNTLFLMWLEVFLTVLTRAIWWYRPCAICSACGSLIANENHGRQTLIDPSKTEWNRVPRKLPVIHDFGIRWNRRKTTSHSLRGKKQNTD